MAVIDAVPGVKVSICINGQPVEEYEDSGEEIDGPLASKTVVKYIEAISDAEFTINTTALPAFEKHRKTRDDILVDTKIDGTWVRGRFQRYAKPNSSAPWSIPMEGVSGVNGAGKSTISAFKFTAIEIGKFANTLTTGVLINSQLRPRIRRRLMKTRRLQRTWGKYVLRFSVLRSWEKATPKENLAWLKRLRLRSPRKLSRAALSHTAPRKSKLSGIATTVLMAVALVSKRYHLVTKLASVSILTGKTRPWLALCFGIAPKVRGIL